MTTEIVPATKRASLIERFAAKYHIEPEKLLTTLKATAFRQRKQDVVITNEQMAALLIVADNFGLNPFTKEIFAFEDKGAIVPVVSVDGWARIINEHQAFDGLEFAYSEEIVTMPAGKACPAWCEVRIFRKDRTRPTVVREYLDEVYQAPRGQNAYAGPWQSHTKRFLRHKTLIQGSRIAFGFAGIYDEDEAQRVIDATPVVAQQVAETVRTPAEPGKSSRLSSIVGAAAVTDVRPNVAQASQAATVAATQEPAAATPTGALDDTPPWEDEPGAAA